MRSPARGAVLLYQITLAWLLCWFITHQAIIPFAEDRVPFVEHILRGEMEPPYQFRLFEHAAARVFSLPARALFETEVHRHIFSYSVSLFFCLLGVQILLGRYLSAWFSRPTVLLGQSLFTALVPLSITGFFVDGDFFTLLYYLGGFVLLRAGRDAWLPLLVFIGTFNREQSVFLVVFYAASLFGKRRLWRRRSLLLIAGSLLSFAVVFLGLRAAFGFPKSRYTFALHIAHNTDPANFFPHVLPLWMAVVLGVFGLAAIAAQRASRSFRFLFASLLPYGVLYFLHGNMWELAKFLPAHLVMLPLALQALSGEVPDQLGPRREP